MATLYTLHLNEFTSSVTVSGSSNGTIGIAASEIGNYEVGARVGVRTGNLSSMLSGVVTKIANDGTISIQTNSSTASPSAFGPPVYTNADLSAFTTGALSKITVFDQDVSVPFIPVKLLTAAGSSVPTPAGSSSIPVVVTPSTSTSTGPANASVTSVVSTILAANSSRKGATVVNTGSVTCYLALGSNATSSVYTVPLVAGAYYEAPFNFVGSITAITASSTTTVSVTEFT